MLVSGKLHSYCRRLHACFLSVTIAISSNKTNVKFYPLTGRTKYEWQSPDGRYIHIYIKRQFVCKEKKHMIYITVKIVLIRNKGIPNYD